MQPSVPAKPGGLALRLRWAVILALPVLLLLYLESPFPEILLLAAAAILAWEWERLCAPATVPGTSSLVLGPALLLMLAGVLLPMGLGAFGLYREALWALVLAIPAVALLGRLLKTGRAGWLALGILYIALPCLAFLWLRVSLEQGRGLAFWLLFVIWATDSAAYLAGRAIGGPKLLPRVSPKKTWAGLAGGMAAAALVGGLGSTLLPGHPLAPLVIGGAVLAVVAQIGDLMESAVKRRFDVKDSSGLIPGHGGLFDRVDGLLTAALALAALLLLRGVNG